MIGRNYHSLSRPKSPQLNLFRPLQFFLSLFSLLILATFTTYAGDDEDPRRVIEFAGREWYVKDGIGLGPGNNNWSDDRRSVWVDDEGRLHLRIRQIDGVWYSAQVTSVEYTTPGTHRFYVETALNDLDEHVVFGMFLYRDDEHELDIEISQQGQRDNHNAKFAVQPYYLDGHRSGFFLEWDGATVHEIDWQAETVSFASFRREDDAEVVIHEWVYEGENIPEADLQLRIQINLWLSRRPPADEQEIEVVISDLEAPSD